MPLPPKPGPIAPHGRWILCATVLIAAAGPAIAARPVGYPRSYDDVIAAARSEGALIVYANTDLAVAAPAISGFKAAYPGITVRYVDMVSQALYRRFVGEVASRKPTADFVWSSAMDLQVKLINDGYAQSYASPEKPALPATAVWKNMGYGITAEPIGFVYNKRLMPAASVPKTHAALDGLLRAYPQRYAGRIATFDAVRSGVGFLYLSQDLALTRDTWSLWRSIAATKPALFETTGPMIDAVAAGKQLLAYNVVASYALERAKRDPAIGVVLPADYTLTMSRIGFVPNEARHPNAARLFLDYLLSRRGQTLLAERSLAPVRVDVAVPVERPPYAQAHPIRVGPQLLANLDRLRRQRILRQWSTILQAR